MAKNIKYEDYLEDGYCFTCGKRLIPMSKEKFKEVKKEYKEQVNIYPEFEKEFPIEEYLNTCENCRTRKEVSLAFVVPPTKQD